MITARRHWTPDPNVLIQTCDLPARRWSSGSSRRRPRSVPRDVVLRSITTSASIGSILLASDSVTRSVTTLAIVIGACMLVSLVVVLRMMPPRQMLSTRLFPVERARQSAVREPDRPVPRSRSPWPPMEPVAKAWAHLSLLSARAGRLRLAAGGEPTTS
jgi:hypothetical protein